MCACVFWCMFACFPVSGTEGSRGFEVWHTLGFDAFSVVVIHHLVGDFCQNTLSQRGWGGLQTQRQAQRGHKHTRTHRQPCVILGRQEFTCEPAAVKGPDRWDWCDQTSSSDNLKTLLRSPVLSLWYRGWFLCPNVFKGKNLIPCVHKQCNRALFTVNSHRAQPFFSPWPSVIMWSSFVEYAKCFFCLLMHMRVLKNNKKSYRKSYRNHIDLRKLTLGILTQNNNSVNDCISVLLQARCESFKPCDFFW